MTDISVRKMTEEQLLQEVARRCQERGIWWVHIDTPYRNRKKQNMTGFPDLLLCGTRIIFRELKSEYGKMSSPAQTDWKYRLLAAGESWDIWKPSDLVSGRIDRELDALA